MMSETVIHISNVSKFYKLYKEPKDRLKEALNPLRTRYHKKYYALSDISLDIKKGDVVGIVGRNGSGKSTLLKLISGVLTANSGVISVRGKVTALLELGAGFNPEFSGIDNIHFYAKILGMSDKELDEKLQLIIDFAELGEYLFQPIKTYSSGMKARLGFSIAVHVDPEILILDEVLSVGDSLFRRKCYARMEEFFKAGKTIIYVSHDINSINLLCNRAILLYKGKVLLDGNPKEVTKNYERMLFTKGSPLIVPVDNALNQNEKESPPVRREVEDNKSLQAFLIDGLKPKSTIMYQDYDVKISSPCFKTLNDEKVNCLIHREKYKFTANVDFGISAKVVSFGFIIKDLRGQTVVSIESKKQYDYGYYLENITAGSSVKISIVFPCIFTNGDYYIDFGVSSFYGEQVILTRGVDLSMFRVVNPKPFSTGLVDVISDLQVEIDGKLSMSVVNE